MAGAFETRRSRTAREGAGRQLAATERQVARLVELTTSLADRIEALPATTALAARDRQERVAVLRRTAAAGAEDLARRAARTPDEHGTG